MQPLSKRVQQVLRVLDRAWVGQHVTRVHDEAREGFCVTALTLKNAHTFAELITTYVQHHLTCTGHHNLSDERACNTARQLLTRHFPRGTYQDGYQAALATALGQQGGGLPSIINALCAALKHRAVHQHLERVYHDQINVLNKEECTSLATALATKYRPGLATLGCPVNEFIAAQDPLHALTGLKTILERVLSMTEGL